MMKVLILSLILTLASSAREWNDRDGNSMAHYLSTLEGKIRLYIMHSIVGFYYYNYILIIIIAIVTDL